jgi:hypothetical protein
MQPAKPLHSRLEHNRLWVAHSCLLLLLLLEGLMVL